MRTVTCVRAGEIIVGRSGKGGPITISRLRIRKIGLVFAGLCLTLPLIFGGCAVLYEQRGKTQVDFDRDKKYCESIAEREYQRKGTRVCDEVDACLKSRGWSADSPSLW